MAVQVVRDVEHAVLRYMLVNVMINAGQGVCVALALWWLKVPNPIIWGILTFVLEFIPYLAQSR